MTTLLQDLLTQLDAPGTFATQLRAPANNLAVEVIGVGPLDFPITPQLAKKLRRVASASPFGLREQTLHDPNVRNSWEIAASQVKIDEHRWNPALATYLETIRSDLGLADECNLEAVLDKLLVYEEGQFFKPHQDSEKCDQMIGTLVVLLPSEYSGGVVTVEHRGEKAVFRRIGSQTKDLSLLAFYADCHHAVSAVENGVRVALTYQLKQKGPSKTELPEIHGDMLERLTTCVRDHFKNPIVKRFARSEPTPPERLVYLLDHEYTQHSLSWNSLKNGDRIRVAALRTVAERLDCECFLALVEVHEVWTCTGDDDWNQQYGIDDDEDDDESLDDDGVDSEKYELNDLVNWDFSLQLRMDSAGEPMEGVLGSVHDDELFYTKPSSDMHPFKSEYEGYQGNYGNTLDRWYHRAAFMMWPRANSFALRAEASPQWAVRELLALPRAHAADLELRVKALLPHWEQTACSVESEAFFAELLELSTRLNDSALAHAWLIPLGLERLGREAMTRNFAPLIDKHGLSWAKELLSAWMQHRPPGLAPWVPLLAEICGDLHAGTSATCKDLAAWLLDVEVNIARKRFVVAFQYLPPWLDLDGFVEESKHLAHVLAAAIGISAFQVIDDTFGFLLNAKKDVPPSFFVALLRESMARSPALGAYVIGSSLHRECITRLEAILCSPARKEGDWTMAYRLGCTCDDCKVLMEFLGSSRTEHDWRLKKERRQHIHQAIDLARLPVRHTTLHKGSPHLLQLRKDPSLFSLDRAYRARVKKILDALPAVPSR